MEEPPQDQQEKQVMGAICSDDGHERHEQERVRRHDESDKNRVVSSVMSWPSHLIFVIFTIYIIYLSFQDYNLFSWHPTCMTIGSLLLMAEAVMAMSPDNLCASKLSHQGKARLHWILQAGAAGFIFAGFLVIVINKNLNNKRHFHSWHGIIGLVFFICVGVTSSGGVMTLYSLSLKKIIKPAKMKLLHNLVGIVTFSIGVITEILGMYTNWFPKHSSPTAQVIFTVFLVLGAIFALEGALKSAYSRFKALYQSI